MLYKKGAEANLYLEEWYGKKIIKKHRYKKLYRNNLLDFQLRKQRTFQEAKLMLNSRKIGVPTPFIYLIDVKNTNIYMDFIEGKQIKRILDKIPNRDKICEEIGRKIATLHVKNIIHGDLTTSNLIISESKKIFFIDFGLGGYSTSIEDKGVDLHLMDRCLKSTHYIHAKKCFNSVLVGYEYIAGSEFAEKIKLKLEEIDQRGRYFDRT
jgi:Kae1-associated kinase Bud32